MPKVDKGEEARDPTGGDAAKAAGASGAPPQLGAPTGSAYLPGHSARPAEQHIEVGTCFALSAREEDALHPVFLHARALFDGGYYWEAHEYWEALWLHAPRESAEGALLRGLIVLAAAAIKVRQGRCGRVAAMAERAARHVEFAAEGAHRLERYVALEAVQSACALLCAPGIESLGDPGLPVQVVYPMPLAPARSEAPGCA